MGETGKPQDEKSLLEVLWFAINSQGGLLDRIQGIENTQKQILDELNEQKMNSLTKQEFAHSLSRSKDHTIAIVSILAVIAAPIIEKFIGMFIK